MGVSSIGKARFEYWDGLVGFQLVGDQLQQKPISISGDRTPKIQDFDSQMKLSYLERWVSVGLPLEIFDCQTHMDHNIARFSTKFTYNVKYKYSETANDAPRSLDIWEAVLDWLQTTGNAEPFFHL